jgi:hypothetical protein
VKDLLLSIRLLIAIRILLGLSPTSWTLIPSREFIAAAFGFIYSR